MNEVVMSLQSFDVEFLNIFHILRFVYGYKILYCTRIR